MESAVSEIKKKNEKQRRQDQTADQQKDEEPPPPIPHQSQGDQHQQTAENRRVSRGDFGKYRYENHRKKGNQQKKPLSSRSPDDCRGQSQGRHGENRRCQIRVAHGAQKLIAVSRAGIVIIESLGIKPQGIPAQKL